MEKSVQQKAISLLTQIQSQYYRQAETWKAGSQEAKIWNTEAHLLGLIIEEISDD